MFSLASLLLPLLLLLSAEAQDVDEKAKLNLPDKAEANSPETSVFHRPGKLVPHRSGKIRPGRPKINIPPRPTPTLVTPIAQGNESIDIDSLYISWIGTPRCKTPQKKKITSGWDDAIRIAEMVSGSIDWAGAAEQVSRAFPIQHGLPCTRPGNLQNAATFKRGTWTPFFAYAGCADWRNECTIGKQVSRTEMNLQRYIADK
jgi:hypothetical protein